MAEGSAPAEQLLDAMMHATGTNEIPVLLADDGEILEGDDEIMAWLDRFHERARTLALSPA